MSAVFATGGNIAGSTMPTVRQPLAKKYIVLNTTSIALGAVGTLAFFLSILLALSTKYVYAQHATATSFVAKMNTVPLFSAHPLPFLITGLSLLAVSALALTLGRKLLGYKGKLFTWAIPATVGYVLSFLLVVPIAGMLISQTGSGNAVYAADQQLTTKAEAWLAKNYGLPVSLQQPKDVGDDVTKTYLLKSLTTGRVVTFKYTLDNDVNLTISDVQTQPVKTD
jgi:hypothetical protein